MLEIRILRRDWGRKSRGPEGVSNRHGIKVEGIYIHLLASLKVPAKL